MWECGDHYCVGGEIHDRFLGAYTDRDAAKPLLARVIVDYPDHFETHVCCERIGDLHHLTSAVEHHVLHSPTVDHQKPGPDPFLNRSEPANTLHMP